ncbi:MAG: DUF6259 domain-containing protein [Gemmatimonadota bacterium]|nr:DUF6259 domain-containing protein [Gemmatimonadota bacterium]
MTRTTRLLLASVSLALASTVTAQGTAPTLVGGGVRLILDATHGGIRRLESASGQEVAVPTDETLSLFRLERAPGQAPIEAKMAARFTWSRIDGPKPGLDLQWEGFKDYSTLRVHATVHLDGDSTTAWRVSVDGLRDVGVERVVYPRLGGIGLTEMADLAVPLWMGQRAKDPRSMLSGPDGKGRRFEWGYPGQLSMQLIALTRGAVAGLYVATDDSLAYRKSFIMSGDQEGYGRVEIAQQLSDPAQATAYQATYAVKLGVVHGTWMHAAERYRAWGERQRWARESRVATGTATTWMRETGVWVWNRGRASQVLDPAVTLRKTVGLPVSVFWHWWHAGPYDTSFPDYLPPRDGAAPFTAAVKAAHAADVRAIVYMNQRLWCVKTPSWTRENAERWAVRERDGTVRLETYNIFDPIPCAPMDIATKFWRDKYAGIADTVVKQYGIDGIYMDQAVLSLVCWSPNHGHPVGGGHYWMDGFRALAADMRKRNGTSLGLAGEGGGESWLPDLDAFLTLQVSAERYADPTNGWTPIPLFQAVYHQHAITYGTYGSLTYPPYDEMWPDSTRPANALTLLDAKYRRQFLMEQARMFVWGMQPTIANLTAEQFTKRAAEIDYLARLARLRHAYRPWMQDGAFVIPPASDAPELSFTGSRISIYAARRGGATEVALRAPAVLTGAWRAANGQVAISLASIDDAAHRVTLTLDPARHGTTRGATLWRVDGAGRHKVGALAAGATSVAVDVAALEGVLLFIEPSR